MGLIQMILSFGYPKATFCVLGPHLYVDRLLRKAGITVYESLIAKDCWYVSVPATQARRAVAVMAGAGLDFSGKCGRMRWTTATAK